MSEKKHEKNPTEIVHSEVSPVKKKRRKKHKNKKKVKKIDKTAKKKPKSSVKIISESKIGTFFSKCSTSGLKIVKENKKFAIALICFAVVIVAGIIGRSYFVECIESISIVQHVKSHCSEGWK